MSPMMPRDSDYTYMFWNHGWRGESAEGKRVMSIQTGRYACAFDTERAVLLHFGELAKKADATQALTAGNDLIYDLPAASLSWHLEADSTSYQVRGSRDTCRTKENLEALGLPLSLLDERTPGEQTRMIVSGRFVQRFDMERLCFESDSGDALPVAGRVEVTALPDYVAVTMEVTAERDVELSRLTARLKLGACETEAGEELVIWVPQEQRGSVHRDEANGAIEIAVPGTTIGCDTPLRLTFFVDAEASESCVGSEAEIRAQGIAPYSDSIPVEYDADRGLHWLSLPEVGENWDMEGNRDFMERVRLVITNSSPTTARVPLVFAKSKNVAGITGMTPMLRQVDGQPLGIPVQISKNWHSTAGKRFLYQGPWFQGYSLLTIEPETTFECELTIAYAQWGGVPAASHAQLCLIGYGGNQLWDQAAIGSYGETITYDPDVNLGRSMIDDVRPLLLEGMHEAKWGWTNNVGGGDFLVYFNERNEKQYLTRMKAFYEQYGPNLTNVHYAGVSADGKIKAHMKVSSPRCDDLSRSCHWFRYEVKEPVEFSRLAFYQLGADGYNNHQFNQMAWGDKDGLREEWTPGKGGLVYERTGLQCDGDQIWFSLHDSLPGLAHSSGFREATGAWANRGLVVRSWSARLGGKDAPVPYASVFLTDDHIASANVELSAPPDVGRLLPGDYVECEVEFLVLPICAEHYYGPNAPLRVSLETAEHSWEAVQRQAAGNQLTVTASQGTVLHGNPVTIRVDAADGADFEIRGGVSYVPIVIVGLSAPDGYRLQLGKGNGGWTDFDQSVHGNDFWQTEYCAAQSMWTRVYNVDLGTHAGEQAFRIMRDA